MVTTELILTKLPPYRDEWKLINPHQYVPDIIEEICAAHALYGCYYDLFSAAFYTTNAKVLCDELYRFCKRNIKYQEESVDRQTTALPTGILSRGHGDCKHYALFNAGVIASLNRVFGCNFEWSFMFAGYGDATEPYHVFVNVRDCGEEIWLDPTPGSGGEPSVLIERFV